MEETIFPGIGTALVLVLPFFALAVVALLTAPFALWIGRRHDEEEQVIRAPLIVALVAIALEGGLAAALSWSPMVRDEFRVAFGGAVLWMDTYTAGTVVALAAVALVTLVASELLRPARSPLGVRDIVLVLALWATATSLAVAGDLHCVAVCIVLANIAVGIVLMAEGLRHPKPARIWLIVAGVALPMLALVLLAGYRGINVGEDIFDARSILRATEGPKVHALLLKTWLAGGLLPMLALVALAAAPRERLEHMAPAAMVLGVALAGFLPILLRTTVAAFPEGSPTYAYAWLSWRAVPGSIGLGMLVVGIANVQMANWRRALLLGVGSACSLSAIAASLTEQAALGSLFQAVSAGVMMPLFLAAIPAVEGAARRPGAGPLWVPWTFTRVLPVLAPHAWGAYTTSINGKGFGPSCAAVLLFSLILATGIRLMGDLVRSRNAAIDAGRFPKLRQWSRGATIAREIGVVVVLALVVACVLMVWLPGIMHIAPPLK